MPKVALKAGVEVDFLSAKELADELNRLRDDLRHMIGSHGRIVNFEGTVTIPAAGGDATIKMTPQGPVTGYGWDVRRVNVAGQDANTVIAGKAIVYRGGDISNPYNFVDFGTLPNVGTWSQHQFTLRNDEVLQVRLTGVAASTVMFASGQALELPADQLFGTRAV